MKHIFGKKGQSGFSLVELMIVVGIIGVLATLALPRFKQFQAKAKMAEAGNILSHIYTLEQSYQLDNSVFSNLASYGAVVGSTSANNCTFGTDAQALGFTIDPCPTTPSPTPRFSYGVVATATGFQANAQTGGAGNNRVCVGNNPFTIGINEKNETRWQTGATTGAPSQTTVVQVGSVCAN